VQQTLVGLDNYRTTAQNLRYAMSVLDGGDYVDLEDASEEMGHRSARSGPMPRVEAVSSITDALEVVADQVRRWLLTSCPRDPWVFAHDRYQRDRIVTGLAERGVGVRAVDRERPAAGRALVMTMHRAKGTEFSKVVLAGVGAQTPGEQARLAAMDEAERADAELRERSLVYVAATRARDELIVVRRA